MRALLVIATLLIPSVAFAVEGKEMAVCAAIDNSVERLACFDKLAMSRGLAPSVKTATPKGAGDWHVSKKVDPLNDKEVHFVMLLAESGKGRFGERVALAVRCASNKTELWLDWNSFLGTESTRTTFRVDKNPAQTSSWPLSTDKKAAFYPGSPVALLRGIADSQSFVANVTPYNENPITAVFETRGAGEALADLRKACNW